MIKRTFPVCLFMISAGFVLGVSLGLYGLNRLTTIIVPDIAEPKEYE